MSYSYAQIPLLVLRLSGNYLLFDLLQGRLFDGALHRLLLDGLHHLLLVLEATHTNHELIATE